MVLTDEETLDGQEPHSSTLVAGMSRSGVMKRAKTATFLLELPLQVDWESEHPVRAHLEAARCLYNALLSEAMKRLRCMRSDPAWAKARDLPRSHQQERAQAFSALRKQYHFSEYNCTRMRNVPVHPGSLTTLTVRWLKLLRPVPIRRSIVSVSGAPNVCAFAAVGAASIAWRASATMSACVLC